MENRALDLIRRHNEAGAALRNIFFEQDAKKVAEAAKQMAVCLVRGGKILLAGNGGSAADAQHWAGEFVNRFMLDRAPLPALALTTDSSVLTAIANDFGYAQVFAKQIDALGRPGDIFLAISTSGKSENLIQALQAARHLKMFCIGIASDDGGSMQELCDLLLAVPMRQIEQKFADAQLMRTPLVQEVHEAIGHLLCALVDFYLFDDVNAIKPMMSTGGHCPYREGL